MYLELQDLNLYYVKNRASIFKYYHQQTIQRQHIVILIICFHTGTKPPIMWIFILHSKLPDHVISRNADINWSVKLCDLISLDFFWGYVKVMLTGKQPMISNQNIQRVIRGMKPVLCAKP